MPSAKKMLAPNGTKSKDVTPSMSRNQKMLPFKCDDIKRGAPHVSLFPSNEINLEDFYSKENYLL